jgi:hypothetical protein
VQRAFADVQVVLWKKNSFLGCTGMFLGVFVQDCCLDVLLKQPTARPWQSGNKNGRQRRDAAASNNSNLVMENHL